jgi:hypothetical protein
MSGLTTLTPTQRRRLAGLSADWREESDDWKAGKVFLDLQDMGFCEMADRRVKGGDVMCGPGNTSVYRWFTRRTEAGTRALADDFSRRTIKATQRATR